MAIYTKKVSVGAFLKKGEDIKENDIVIIGSEGQQVPSQFNPEKTQDIFLLKTANGKEGNTAFNQTTINHLVEVFGEDSKNWIGKRVKVWSILQNVQGKMKHVFYFTHPEAYVDDEGMFSMPPQPQGMVKPNDPNYIDPNSINF